MLAFTAIFVCVLQLGGVDAAPPQPNPVPKKVHLRSRNIERGSLLRRALSPQSIPLKDYFNQTDLQ
jgi:hypothetical protein